MTIDGVKGNFSFFIELLLISWKLAFILIVKIEKIVSLSKIEGKRNFNEI